MKETKKAMGNLIALMLFAGSSYAEGKYTALWFTEGEESSTGIGDAGPPVYST